MMSDDRTPADEYRDARTAYLKVTRRIYDLSEESRRLSDEATRLGMAMKDAQHRLLDWIVGEADDE